MTDTPEDRHSKAAIPELVTDPDEKAKLEGRNALRQFDTVMRMIRYWLDPDDPPGRPFRLRPSTIYDLQRIAVEGLTHFAGIPRPAGIEIKGSKHVPPASAAVPAFIEDLCDYVTENWDKSPVHLAAYAMWRLNWIHPFVDGNGRTARVLSYLILSVRSGHVLPGEKTVPHLIADNKGPYYAALEAADEAEKQGRLDLSELEQLLGSHLATQLYSVHQDATNNSE